MSRTALLVAGAICWTIAGADAGVHLLNGDLLIPAVMGAVLVVWVGLRRLPGRQRATAEAAETAGIATAA